MVLRTLVMGLLLVVVFSPAFSQETQSPSDNATTVEPPSESASSFSAKEAVAQEGKGKVARRAAQVLEEIMEIPDQRIPLDLLQQAQCVAIFPAMIQAGFILGANYGYGIVSCRQSSAAPWGAPAFFTLAGGSVGFQIGAKSTDLILLVMNRQGVTDLCNATVTLSTDMGIAAGPVGRSASAATDPSFQATFLSYSRSEGLFAGVDLGGSVLTYDVQATRALYGHEFSAKNLLLGEQDIPPLLTAFPQALSHYAPGEESRPSAAERSETTSPERREGPARQREASSSEETLSDPPGH